jgi:hypothetical protein
VSLVLLVLLVLLLLLLQDDPSFLEEFSSEFPF